MSRVDDILASLELTSVLPPDVNLRSVGRDKYRGNCPLGRHRSLGTFAVARHPDGHQVWHCFACNARGSVIDLVAAIEGMTIRDTIRKLSEKNCVPISDDAIMQRALDQINRNRPEFGYLLCDAGNCSSVKPLASELDFAILRSGGNWQWKVSPNGKRAICYKH